MKHDRLLNSLVGLAFFVAAPLEAVEKDWIALSFDAAIDSWGRDCLDWTQSADVRLDPANPSALIIQNGKGVLVSTLQGRADFRNLRSKEDYGDIEAHIEFFLPKSANAGVKMQGLYEIQIRDTHKKKKPAGNDCGGVYPRARATPPYHLIDKGVPPRVNAAKPAGQWQTLDIFFQTPRFNLSGKKTENARFLKVVLNDIVIHKNVEVKWPTGHAWATEPEVAKGPLYLQGDHGPIAYRNVRVRSLSQVKE